MDEAKTLVGAEVASVFLVDRARQELYSTVNSTKGELRIPITAGIAGHVATTGEPVVIQDAYNDQRFNKVVDLKTGFKTRNVMCVPLKVKKGAVVIGVVQLINKVSDSMASTSSTSRTFGPFESLTRISDDQHFTADDLHFLQAFASQAATAVSSNGLDPVHPELEDKQHGSALDNVKVGTEQKTIEQPNKFAVAAVALQETGAEEPVALQEAKARGSAAEAPASSVEERADRSLTLEDHVDPHVDLKVSKLLTESLNSWQLDTLALADITNNRPMSTLGVYLFTQLGLAKHYDLNEEKRTRPAACRQVVGVGPPSHSQPLVAAGLHGASFSWAAHAATIRDRQ